MNTIKKVATWESDMATVTGNYGNATATGDYGVAEAVGDYSRATVTGEHGSASATGYLARASATGDLGNASATGEYGQASNIGYCGRASAIGKYGVAIAGHRGAAKADASGCVAVLYWDGKSQRPRLAVGYVGEGGIKANTWYCVESGTLKEAVE